MPGQAAMRFIPAHQHCRQQTSARTGSVTCGATGEQAHRQVTLKREAWALVPPAASCVGAAPYCLGTLARLSYRQVSTCTRPATTANPHSELGMPNAGTAGERPTSRAEKLSQHLSAPGHARAHTE